MTPGTEQHGSGGVQVLAGGGSGGGAEGNVDGNGEPQQEEITSDTTIGAMENGV